MHKRTLLILLAAVLVLSACQGKNPTLLKPGSESSAPQPSSSKKPSKYQYIFKTPTNPFHLSLEAD